MANAADILIRILGDSSGFSKATKQSKEDVRGLSAEVDKAGQSVSAFGSIVQGVFQGIGQAIFRSIGTGISAAVGEIGKSISAASDLAESVNKVGVAFGAAGQEILDWSKTSATALGQSQQQALEAASSFGLLFNTLGVGQEDSAKMSKALVQLATDMASINNIPVADALQKLRSGLVGEAEPLRTVGVLLSETAVQQEAVRLGLAASTDAVSEQSKVLARYQLILDQTVQTQGDFARTSNGIANQERILGAHLDDLSAQFGQTFTPIYAVILQGLNELVAQVSPYGENIIHSLAEGMVNGIIYLLPVIAQIRSVFAYWLEAHSPPKLLPDLAKWGAAAMNAYLQGWTTADFGALKELGGSIESILRSFVGTGAIGETDLVGRIFGSTNAVANAVSEFRRLGTVSSGSLDAIRRAAGPAGDAVSGMVSSYFDLEKATRAATDAQRELDDVTRLYDARLKPLNDKLDANQAHQQKIRDNQRLKELGDTVNDPTQSVSDRQLARLEQEEILLRQQQSAVEKEKDAAVDGAKQKLDAATKEQAAKKEIYDQQTAALDLQVKTNSLIGEEADLRQRLADEAIAKQKAALAELEAEKRKGDAADKERQAELERIYQAQLRYNLQIADTPGKIALMRLELGRYKDGSAEYYGILTQIAGLEQQLASEREKAAKGAGTDVGLGAILPPASDLKVDGWASDLADKLNVAIHKAFQNPAREPLSLADILREPGDVPAMSEDVKAFADALRGFSAAVIEVTPPLKGLLALFDPEEPKKNQGKIIEDQITWLDTLTFNLKFWAAATKNDWTTAWDAYKDYAATTEDGSAQRMVVWVGEMIGTLRGHWKETSEGWGTWFSERSLALGTWLADTAKAITDFDLSGSATALLKSFYDGLTKYWTETVEPWWKEKTQWNSDLLPGSEPKNPASPLRGLADRGEALMGNLQRGMETGAGAMQTSFSGAMGSLAGATTTNSTANHLGPIQLVFNGPVSNASARSAASTLDGELRKRGWK